MRDTLDFLLNDWLDFGRLLARPRFAHLDAQAVAALLQAGGELANRHLAPHAARSDANEPRLVDGRVVLIPEIGDALSACADAGFFGLDAPLDENGLQLPHTLVTAIAAQLTAANTTTWAYVFLTMAAANLLRIHGSAQQRARWLPPMVRGSAFGTMCLSEPHAGSSVGDIRTLAVAQPDGSYALRGSKMWISGGEHPMGDNIHHLVLAKIPGGPPGTKGISLFIVPRLRGASADLCGLHALADDPAVEPVSNGITVAGLNHKLGYRGTVNCLLNLGEHEPCIGELVGAAHSGMAAMFQMMNEARIGVGVGAASIGLAGYQVARDYARERRQGRLPSERDAQSPMRPIIEHADVRRMLLKAKSQSEGALALCLYAARLTDEIATADPDGAEPARALLDLLTPIVKAWPADYALQANDLAIQVLGGAGYTRDFPVERLWRDNRLNSIHEGTNGIQALDLLGRKVVANSGIALRLLCKRIEVTCDRAAADEQLGCHGHTLRTWLPKVAAAATAVAARMKSGEVELAMANASLFLDVTGHLVVAWLWLDQALTAKHLLALKPPLARSNFLCGKIAAAEYFLRWELPTKQHALQLFAAVDRTVFDTDPAYL